MILLEGIQERIEEETIDVLSSAHDGRNDVNFGCLHRSGCRLASRRKRKLGSLSRTVEQTVAVLVPQIHGRTVQVLKAILESVCNSAAD